MQIICLKPLKIFPKKRGSPPLPELQNGRLRTSSYCGTLCPKFLEGLVAKAKNLRKSQVQLHALAERVLRTVAAHPEIAFRVALARRIPQVADSTQSMKAYLEDLRVILRRLEHKGLLVSKRVPHPNGCGDWVMSYTITPKGAAKLSKKAH